MALNLTRNALTTLETRYLRKDEKGRPTETPEELFHRVAAAVAAGEAPFGGHRAVEEARERFFELMTSLTFLPNSPTLMNAGTDLGQLSACLLYTSDAADE